MVSLRGICLLLQLVQPRRWRAKSAMKPTSRPPHWKGCHRWIHEERKSVWLALVLQIPCEKVSGTQNSLAEGIGVSESYISTYYFLVDSLKINHRTIVLWILWGWRECFLLQINVVEDVPKHDILMVWRTQRLNVPTRESWLVKLWAFPDLLMNKKSFDYGWFVELKRYITMDGVHGDMLNRWFRVGTFNSFVWVL